MKYILPILMAALMLFPSCAEKAPVVHMGLDVTVEAIDLENQQLTVSSTSNSVEKLGEKATLDCSATIKGDEIFYVDYADDKGPVSISFSDLKIGDSLIISVSEEELKGEDNLITVEQIQLGTQRLS